MIVGLIILSIISAAGGFAFYVLCADLYEMAKRVRKFAPAAPVQQAILPQEQFRLDVAAYDKVAGVTTLNGHHLERLRNLGLATETGLHAMAFTIDHKKLNVGGWGQLDMARLKLFNGVIAVHPNCIYWGHPFTGSFHIIISLMGRNWKMPVECLKQVGAPSWRMVIVYPEKPYNGSCMRHVAKRYGTTTYEVGSKTHKLVNTFCLMMPAEGIKTLKEKANVMEL